VGASPPRRWPHRCVCPPAARPARTESPGNLKSKGAIPSDSFVTFGNTYVRKVCCIDSDLDQDFAVAPAPEVRN
jgi:hypothetical protein